MALEVELARPPDGPLRASIGNAKSQKELKLAPYIEAVPAGPKRAKLTYALRVDPAARTGNYRLFAVLELKDRTGLLATASIDHSIDVVPAKPTLQTVETAKKAAAAQLALEGELARLRAEVELDRLRAAVDAADPAVSDAALLALGSVSKGPGPAHLKAASGETIGRSLELAASALSAGRLDEAEAYLDKLRANGRLDRLELAQVLALLGALDTTRGRAPEAEKNYGRALCIDPQLDPHFFRALHSASFETAKRAPNACTAPVSVESVSASRVDGKTIFVRAKYTRDPHQLIGGGDIEIIGSGGGVQRGSNVRASDGALEATIEGGAENQTYENQLLVRVLLRDLSGVVVASFGDPDPLAIPLEGSGGPGLDIPWWVWAIAGGVVAAAGATTAIVLATDRDVSYGIGPISAEF